MATAIANSLTDHSPLDGTNDAINGAEVDANPMAIAQILDGTTATDLGGAGTLDILSLRVLDLGNAAGAVQTNLVLEWDPADGGQMTDNSSGVGIDFKMPDDGDTQDIFGSINVMCLDDAAGGEDGEMSFKVMKNGTNTEILTLSATSGVTFGVDDTGYDFLLYGASAGAFSLWDSSADTHIIRGATAAGPGKLNLSTGELTVVDGDILGRIDFQAPLEASGTDAIAVGASIWAEADDTFASGLNDTDLVFAVAESEVAAERMRLSYDGTTVGLTFPGVTTISTAAGALNLTPAAGSAIVLDGTISVDAGVVTGATAITLSGELDAGSLDVSGNADIDGTLEADAYTVDGTALNEYIADTIGAMVTSNTETGITVAYQDADNTLDFTIGTLNQDTTGTAALATTVTITDNESTNETNAIVFTAGGDVDGGNLGLESDGNLTYNPSSGLLSSTAVNTGALTATGAFTSIGIDDNAASVMFTIDSSQRGIMGHTSTLYGHRLELVSTQEQGLGLARFSAANTSNSLDFMKSRSASLGTNTIVVSGDSLGSINWRGADGATGWDKAAMIAAHVDGTPGASSDMPGRLAFYTSGDGSDSPTERMRITSAGKIGIGTTAPDYLLHVNSGASPSEVQLQVQANAAGGFSVLTYAADNTYLLFDAEYVGDAWKSLDAGSNFYIQKGSDKLTIASETGIAVGSTISAWDSLLTLTSAGLLTVTGAITTTAANLINTANTGKLSFEGSNVTQLASWGTNNSTGGILQLKTKSADSSINNNGITIDGAGRVGIGNTAPGTNQSSIDFEISASAVSVASAISCFSTTDTHGPYLTTIKSSSATINTLAATENNENLFVLNCLGVDNAGTPALQVAARIVVDQDAAKGSGYTAGRMEFWTASSSGLAQRMTINNTGDVGIGTTTPNEGSFASGCAVLSIQGAAADDFGVLELISTDATSTNRIGELRFINLNATGDYHAQAGIRCFRDSHDDAVAMAFHTEATGASITEKMRITSAGLVGIGVTPTAELHVKAPSGDTNVKLDGGAGGVYLDLLMDTGSNDEAHIRFIEGAGDGTAGDQAYTLGYHSVAHYFYMSTQDSDGSATYAQVWRVPDGQTTIDANTTWDANVFDYVCGECGRHEAEKFECCGPVAWHDDVALMDEVIHGVGKNKNVVEKLEKLGVVNTYGTLGTDKPELYTSLQKMPWFLMSGMVQMSNRIDELESRLEMN